MLKRLAVAATPDQFTSRAQLRLRKLPVEAQVEVESRDLEDARQEPFRLQAWRIHALLRQESGAALNHFQNGHTDKVDSTGQVQRPKSIDSALATAL